MSSAARPLPTSFPALLMPLQWQSARAQGGSQRDSEASLDHSGNHLCATVDVQVGVVPCCRRPVTSWKGTISAGSVGVPDELQEHPVSLQVAQLSGARTEHSLADQGHPRQLEDMGKPSLWLPVTLRAPGVIRVSRVASILSQFQVHWP
jgi:hypothetical protein